MRIQVTAEAKQALTQLRLVRQELDLMRRGMAGGAGVGMMAGGMGGLAAKTAMATGGFARAGRALTVLKGRLGMAAGGLVNWGKNLQWAGRQLEFRFTLPIALAAGAAFKFAKSFEESMTRVRKVYGDTSMSTQQVATATGKLSRIFMALSNIYGVHAETVADIGAVYAQAGAEGAALGEMTEATVQAMILGNLTLEESTRGIITVMDAYSLSASDLVDTLALLNIIENETPASMQDLIKVIEKSGGTARTAGMDIRELAANAAALIPVGGTAKEVGTALKTMILQITTPTPKAIKALKLLGVNAESSGWKVLTFTQRMEAMTEGWAKLGQQEKLQVARDIVGLRQGNKFLLLMEDRIDAHSRYYSTMEKTADAEMNLLALNRELQTWLTSAPQRWDILTNRMRNMLSSVMLPLLPAIASVGEALVGFAVKFENLSPAMQKFILYGLGILALMGPLAAYIGSFATLFGFMGQAVIWAAGAVLWFGAKLLWLLKPVKLLGSGLSFLASGAKWAAVAVGNAMRGLAVAAVGGLASAGRGALFFANQVRFFLGVAADAFRGFVVRVLVPFASAMGRGMMAAGRGAFIFARTIAIGLLAAAKYMFSWIGSALAPFGRAAAAGFQAAGALAMRAWRITMAFMAPITRAMMIATRTIMVAISATFGPVLAAAGAVMAAVWSAAMTALAYITSVGMIAIQAIIATGGWALVIAAVAAVLLVLAYLFRDRLADAWRFVVDFVRNFATGFAGGIMDGIRAAARGINQLPSVFVGALRALIRVVAAAVRIVRMWLSYLNPFQRHSPSLVDNVRKGVKAINDEYSKLSGVPKVLGRVASAVRALGRAMAGAAASAAASKLAENIRLAALAGVDAATYRTVIASIEATEAAMAGIDGQIKANKATIEGYRGELKQLEGAIKAQELALEGWQNRLDAIDTRIEQETDKLQGLKDVLSGLNAELGQSQSRLDALRNNPVAGTYAFEDASFDNDMEQKGMRLQLAQLKQQLQDFGFTTAEVRSAQEEWNEVQNQTIEQQDQLTDATDAATDANDALAGSFDATSASADEIRQRMALLGGEIESLRGEKLDLRLAGAGSDVLAGLSGQIDQVQGSRRGLAGALATADSSGGGSGSGSGSDPLAYDSAVPPGLFAILDQIDAIEKQLEKSELAGEILDLQESLALDPARKQIADIFRVPEMSLGDILGGIAAEQGNIAAIEAEIRNVEAAIADQELVIASLNDERDILQAGYDAEEAKLQSLQDEYAAIEEAISGVEAAISDLTDAFTELETARDTAQGTLDEAVNLGTEIETAEKAKKAAEEAAADAGVGGGGAGGGLGGGGGAGGGLGSGGDFDVPGGAGGDFDSDMSLDDLLADLEAEAAAMFQTDSVKDMILGWFTGIWDQIVRGWDAAYEWMMSGIDKIFGPTIDKIVGFAPKIADAFRRLWGFGGSVISTIAEFGTTVWNAITSFLGPVFEWIGSKIIGPAMDWIMTNIWNPFWTNIVLRARDEALKIWAHIQPGIQRIKDGFNDLKDKVIEIVTYLWTHAGEIWTRIKDGAVVAWGLLVTGVMNILRPFMPAIGAILTAIWIVVTTIWGVILAVTTGMWNNIVDFIRVAWNMITEIVGAQIGFVSSLIQAGWDIIWGIWDLFQGMLTGNWQLMWDGIVAILQGGWDIIKALFELIKEVAISIWDNLFSGLLDIASSVWDFIKGVFQGAWDGIQSLLQTMWDTGLSMFTGLMDGIHGAASTAWDLVEVVFEGIWTWISGTFLGRFSQITDTIVGAFAAASRGVASVWGGFGSIIARGLNSGIGVINSLAGGINRMTSFFGMGRPVPSIGYTSAGSGYGEWTSLATGGQIPVSEVDGGFIVNRPRAIVGEGSTAYSEYVIPTDPQHRTRAHALLSSLAGKIGMPAEDRYIPPAFASGGVLNGGLPDVEQIFKGEGTQMLGLGGIISWAVNSAKDKFDGFISSGVIGAIWRPIYNMIAGRLNGINGNSIAAIPKGGGRYLLRKADQFIGGVDRGVPDLAPYVAAKPPTRANGDQGRGVWTSLALGGEVPVHPFANGGIVKGGQGGILAHIGEKSYDEAVVPLSKRFADFGGAGDGDGGQTFNFYGDLSFPNVKNGDDADEFLSNLESLV